MRPVWTALLRGERNRLQDGRSSGRLDDTLCEPNICLYATAAGELETTWRCIKSGTIHYVYMVLYYRFPPLHPSEGAGMVHSRTGKFGAPR